MADWIGPMTFGFFFVFFVGIILGGWLRERDERWFREHPDGLEDTIQAESIERAKEGQRGGE